jgi:hypothetical protein
LASNLLTKFNVPPQKVNFSIISYSLSLLITGNRVAKPSPSCARPYSHAWRHRPPNIRFQKPQSRSIICEHSKYFAVIIKVMKADTM